MPKIINWLTNLKYIKPLAGWSKKAITWFINLKIISAIIYWFSNRKDMSRLKKKLMLYFILIAIVSISVSAEIILEMSSAAFKKEIISNIEQDLRTNNPAVKVITINEKAAFKNITDLRNRMILLLVVVSGSIIGAFMLFTKDIVTPMDNIVDATKKLADGDLTVIVPVLTEDEIGQIASLINTMNTNFQNMIIQIKEDISEQRETLVVITHELEDIIKTGSAHEIFENKKMKASDLKEMLSEGKKVELSLVRLNQDLSSLITFISMYKTYKIDNEIQQAELDAIIRTYTDQAS